MMRQRFVHAMWIASVLIVGAAPIARAGPCVPPATLDQCDLLVSSRLTDNVLRYDGATGDFIGEFVTAGSGGLTDPSESLRPGQQSLRSGGVRRVF
jgi:hypothetical protein